MGDRWPEARVESLKQLAADNLSAAEIAAALGDCTRNAVIGKLERLGVRLHGGVNRIKREKPVRVARAKLAAVPVISGPLGLKDLPPDESPFACTLIDLRDHQCRWPLGDPADLSTFRYCGGPRHDDGPYCPRHTKLGTHAAKPRQARGWTGWNR
jgi:GcrA cell cycle regulator